MFHTRPGENASDASAFPTVDPADGVLRQIGEWLRHARTQRGESLDDVGEELRIKPAYLHALERGDLSVMPGRTYALGFLRAYAHHLGYDGDDLVHRVKAATRGAGGRRPELSVPTPVVESRVPKGQLLIVSLVLAGAVYGGWQFVNRDDRASLETIAEVPEELRDGPIGAGVPHGLRVGGDPVRAYASESVPTLPPRPDAVGRTAADLAIRPERDGTGRDVATLPALGPAVVTAHGESRTAAEAAEPPAGLSLDAHSGPDADAPLTAEAERAVTAALMEDVVGPGAEEEVAPGAEEGAPGGGMEAAAAEGVGPEVPAGSAGQSAQELLAALDAGTLDRERERRVYGRANRDARIMVEALETAWVQVRSSDSSYTYTRTLQPGDIYLVPNRRDLALWTGNAGGIRVAVDGRTVPPLGRPREVKRDIPLDPDGLLSRASGR